MSLPRLKETVTGMKFLAFVLLLVCATLKMQDDVQYALLVGGAFAILCGANVANTRKALHVGGAKNEERDPP